MHQSDSVSVLMYSFDGNCLEITRYLSVPGYIRGVLSQLGMIEEMTEEMIGNDLFAERKDIWLEIVFMQIKQQE